MLWVALFVSNAAVLILEIVGARALIPFLGSSVETWAGIITAVILGLALGYWGGGVLADRHAPRARELVALALAAAGLLTITVWSGSDALAVWGLKLIPLVGPTLAALTISFPLLLIPSIFLASVSPLAAKVLLSSLETSAQTVGRISAVAAVGSVSGSLGVALLLVPYLGSFMILISTGVVLIGTALFLVRENARLVVVACAVAATIAGMSNAVFADTLTEMSVHTIVADVDSRYGRIIVSDEERPGGTLRTVRTGPHGVQCGAYVSHESGQSPELPFPYLRVFDSARILAPQSTRVLVLGGCNYSYPREVERTWGVTRVDVVEIDQQMTEIAKKWFGFTPTDVIHPIHLDGRLFLRTATTTYDAIIVDAFGVPLTVPFELLTRESFTELGELLNPGGVVVMNIVGSVTGPGDTYVASVVTTLRAVFPHVGVYQISQVPKDGLQNLIIIASHDVPVPERPLRVYPHKDVLYPVAPALFVRDDALVLTDDYAPTEALAREMRNAISGWR